MDNQPRRFSLMLAAARAAVLWERALARFFPALLVGGVGLIALKSGILAAFSDDDPLAGCGPSGAGVSRCHRARRPAEDADRTGSAHWLDNRNPQGGRAAESWLDALPAGADTAGSRTLGRRIATGLRESSPHTASACRAFAAARPRPYALRNAVALG